LSRRVISGHDLALVLASAIVAGIATAAVDELIHVAPKPLAGRPVDSRFVALGHAYLPQLGKVYAGAWENGAAALDAGKPIPDALESVAQAWTAGRTAAFDRTVEPELDKIVPQTTKDADVTRTERAALAAAWRGLAKGLAE